MRESKVPAYELAAFEDTFASALLGLLGVGSSQNVTGFELRSTGPNAAALLVERCLFRPDAVIGPVQQLITERFVLTGEPGRETFSVRLLRSLGVDAAATALDFKLRVVGPDTAYLTVSQFLGRPADQRAFLDQLRAERFELFPAQAERSLQG